MLSDGNIKVLIEQDTSRPIKPKNKLGELKKLEGSQVFVDIEESEESGNPPEESAKQGQTKEEYYKGKKSPSFFVRSDRKEKESKRITNTLIPEVTVSLGDISSSQTEKKILATKAIDNLYDLRRSLYTYSFKNHPFYNRIEIGINHIVIYPHATQVGRKLLACMVAAMWDERNYPYFNVYEALLDDSDKEGGVRFVLDHSGHRYSKRYFDSTYTAPEEHSHFHPKSSGTYHTHYFYGWHFAGLMAVHSILALGATFLDKGESKDVFSIETVQCLEDFSQHIISILLGTLPFDKMEGLEDLETLLTFIQEQGLFALQSSESMLEIAKSLSLSDETIRLIRHHIKNDDITRILRTFIYDLNTLAKNIKQMSVVDSNLPKFHHFGDKQSVEELFKLACCLHHPGTDIEFIDYEVLQEKAENLRRMSELTDNEQTQLELVTTELDVRELRATAQLDNSEQLQQLRKEFAKSLELTSEEDINSHAKTDEEMVGFRARVAQRWRNNGLEFNSKEVIAGEKANFVSRPQTHAALGQLHSGLKKTPSKRDSVAAEIFLSKVMYFTIGEITSGMLDSRFWEVIYAEIVHRISSDGNPLMTTNAVHGVLIPGATINFARMLPTIKPAVQDEWEEEDSSVIENSEVPQIEIHAHWYNAKEKAVATSSDANVGTLEVLDDVKEIDFPVIDATKVSAKFLESYGVSLHSLSADLGHKDNVTLFATEYQFNEDYVKDYVLQAERGGGLFVETHDFPHYFIPMEDTCHGGLILGRAAGQEDKWTFIAIEVPYGYVLKVEPGVIHGDSFCKGRYTIALAAAKNADSVLFRRKDGEIQTVAQHTVELTTYCYTNT